MGEAAGQGLEGQWEEGGRVGGRGLRREGAGRRGTSLRTSSPS